MPSSTRKIGLGGGCHWCTEGVFSSLTGVCHVNQGWIASTGENSVFSEAVEVTFDPKIISLATLIEIHLYTHACTANHSMREKYRSAIYCYDQHQPQKALEYLALLQQGFDNNIITQVLPFDAFKDNKAEFTNYLFNAPDKPFCQRYIHPKLQLLLQRFSKYVNTKKLADAGIALPGIQES
jgi:peptide-methionine (S)-S-oxide reductase